MIELRDRSVKYGDSDELFRTYVNEFTSPVNKLCENLTYYREKALDLACEKLLLDGICDGCDPSSQTYCEKVRKLVDDD